jgi:pimeloyl-[acyl-carrier protein] methyl ester esterase
MTRDQLHIQTHGSGGQWPLVLIHGWGMHGGVWQPLLERLSPHICLHVVDLPGMGYSHPLESAGLDAMAAHLLQALPAQADFCGWSLGGLVAMRLAMLQPERVRRLVLVGSTPCFVNSRRSDGNAPWQYGVEAQVFHEFAAQVGADYHATLIKFLTLQCMGSTDSRSTVKQLRASFSERPAPTEKTLKDALRMLLDNDLRTEIAALNKPTLLIHGDRDNLAPVTAAQWMAQQLPQAGLRVIAGASHAPFLSHPEQFSEALLQFLETDKPR